MRAFVVDAPRSAALVDLDRPRAKEGEVVVRMEGSGVCGSDLAVWEGRSWFDYPQEPGAPGHEGWGTIAEIGNGVEGLSEGQRVAAISYRAHAEYDVAAADAVVPVPQSVGTGPFPGEALGCAMNVFARSEIQPDHTVAVVGIGFIGALVAQRAARAGARVLAISRRSFSLEVGRAMGATDVVRLDERERVVDAVRDLTDGALCDRVVEAAGLQATLDVAAEITRTRGRLVIAGYHQDGPRTVDMQMWNWRGIDVINAHERDVDVYVRNVRAAVDAIASNELDPTPLYTHAFPLDRLDRALETALERPDGFLKAVTTL